MFEGESPFCEGHCIYDHSFRVCTYFAVQTAHSTSPFALGYLGYLVQSQSRVLETLISISISVGREFTSSTSFSARINSPSSTLVNTSDCARHRKAQ